MDEVIFDCDHVTGLLIEWQNTKDPVLEGQILEGCTSLVEVLVSRFDPMYRDDLIQEAFARILYACKYFLPAIGNLHNYLTSVINNTCITYLAKQAKYISVEDFMENPEDVEEYIDTLQAVEIVDHMDLLAELKERNRKRFPGLPAEDLDMISEAVYTALQTNGSYPKGLAKTLSETRCLSITITRTVCNSSLIWLRYTNLTNATVHSDHVPELTLLKDLEEIVDEKTFKKIRIVFSGMLLRVS